MSQAGGGRNESAIPGPSGGSAPVQATGGIGATRPLRLLLLEDDPGDAFLARAMMKEAGVDAQWTCAGRVADIDFDVAGDWADCALVDLGLSDSQGLEAVRKVLRRAPRVPVVVVSGNADREVALAAVQEGAQDYLVKGHTDAELLVKTVRYAIGRKLIERELQQAQHLARLGRLAGGMAHHYNNLLGAILAYAGFVADAVASAPADDDGRWGQAREDIEQVRQAAQRAADLTRQLTVYAEQDLARAETIQLNDVIEGAKAGLADRVGNKIALKFALAPGLCRIVADRTHVEQLLAILADNARDAMSGCGRMTISTASVKDARLSSTAPPRDCVRLQVHDAGAGISGEILDSVFDPFFTTKPPGQGVGLGLAVVHAIMTRWGGRVDLQSKPGEGTTVTALFPVAAAQPV